jgi:2-polyprenyl-3-methyl-5-hydroxy-6-metoxy-1,4-benzoquinol methylase
MPHPISSISRVRKLALFVANVPPGSRVLEIGPGEGWFSAELRARGYAVTTLDLEGNADIQGDVRTWRGLGIEPGSFDAIVALEVVEHVNCLEDMKGICRPDGFILMSSPHPDWDWLMKGLEALRLTQRRTSPHDYLVDFSQIDLEPIVLRRPMHVHQVALFRNRTRRAAR